jgi:hypothetical protein
MLLAQRSLQCIKPMEQLLGKLCTLELRAVSKLAKDGLLNFAFDYPECGFVTHSQPQRWK